MIKFMGIGKIVGKVLVLGTQNTGNSETLPKKRKLQEFSLFLLTRLLLGEVPVVNFA